MSKISGYANSVSALGTDDLLDVSEKISSSPDVYESRKMTGATLATFISSYAANIISTDGLTMTANRTHDLGSYVLTFQNAGLAIEGAQTIKAASAVADMFNLYDSTSGLLSRFNSTFISFWSTTQIESEVFGVTGHTILKGVDTAGTSKALDIYDNDTVPTSLWSFRNNGDVYLGKSSILNLNGNSLTIQGSANTPGGLTVSNNNVSTFNRTGGTATVQVFANSTSVFSVGASVNYWNGGSQTVNLGWSDGSTANGWSFKGSEWKYYSGGFTTHEIDDNLTRFYVNGFSSPATSRFVVGALDRIGTEEISLQGDTLVGATADKVGFMGTAPIVQITTGVAAAAFTANTSGIADDTATFDGYTIGQIVKALRNYGLLA